MNYPKVDSQVPINIPAKAKSVAVATLLILSLFVWVIPVTPAYAAANATIEASGSSAPWHLSGAASFLIQVSVLEPDFASNGATNTATFTVTQKDASGNTVDTDSVTAQEVGDSGQLVIGLRSDGSATFTNAPSGWTAAYFEVGAGVAEVEGGSVEVSYLDSSGPVTISTTISIDNVSPTYTLDRSEYPPLDTAKVYFTVVDQDLNDDPTAIDTASVTITTTRTDSSGTITTETESITFTETGVNTQTFTGSATLANLKDASGGITDFANGDIVDLKYTDPVAADTSTKTVDLKTAVGSLTLPASVTYSSELTVTLDDFDLNVDSAAKETQTVTLTSIKADGSTLETETVTLTESAVNSASFTKKVSVSWLDTDTYADVSGVLQIRPGGKIKVSYSDSNPSATVEQITTLSSTSATLTAAKDTYGVGASASLSLSDPDLNDATTKVEFVKSATVSAGSAITSIKVSSVSTPVTEVGEISITVDDLAAKAATGGFVVTFKEDGKDVGTFTASVALSSINDNGGNALANGDRVKITYKDLLDATTSSVTFTVTAVTPTVSLDRTQYPVARDTVSIHISVDDADQNAVPTQIETVTIGDGSSEKVLVTKADGTTLYNYVTEVGNLVLTESGPNTGVFEATITLAQDTISDTPAWINAKLTVAYTSATAAKTVSKEARFLNNDASLSLSAATAIYGDKITVTVTDQDENLNSKSKQSFTVSVTYTTTAGASATTTVTVTETGVDTGVFTKEVTIGDATGFVKPKPGTKITFKKTDDTAITTTSAQTSWPTGTTKSASLTISTFTGSLTVSATELGPGAKFTVTLTDKDLNLDLLAADTATVKIKSTTDPTGISATVTETGVSTGVFNVSVTTILTGTSAGGTSPTIKIVPGDTIQAVYLDAANAAGSSASQIQSISVISVDPTFTFDKDAYKVSEIATIQINDLDANVDPSLIDTLTTVTITSDSDPIGVKLTFAETGVNTGIFEGKILLTDDPTVTGALFVKTGDTVTVSYKDTYPAGWDGVTVKATTFTATAKVGVTLPPTERVPASTPELVDSAGNALAAPSVGTVAIIQATVTNNASTTQTFTFIVQIKDSSGVVVSINWIQDLSLVAGGSMKPGVSWTPTAAGDYTIEVFVWQSISDPVALSPVFTKTVTVV